MRCTFRTLSYAKQARLSFLCSEEKPNFKEAPKLLVNSKENNVVNSKKESATLL